MRRLPLLRIVGLLLFALAAIKIMPLGHALSSASVNFGGNYSVTGTGTRFIYCTVSPLSLSIPRPGTGSGTNTDTSTLTCYNNLPTAITLQAQNGSISPGGGSAPDISWNPSSGTMSIPAGGSASVIITFSVRKQDTARTYTYTFDVNDITASPILTYSHTGYSISVTVT